jgi:hypothetical protein
VAPPPTGPGSHAFWRRAFRIGVGLMAVLVVVAFVLVLTGNPDLRAVAVSLLALAGVAIVTVGLLLAAERRSTRPPPPPPPPASSNGHGTPPGRRRHS